jgi:branched-chain amino acid transport system substrate-binding protein
MMFFSYSRGDDGERQVQYDAGAERIFQQALTEYQHINYAGAVRLFDSLVQFPNIHQRTTAAYIMEAKALFELNRFDSSVSVLMNFQNRFPATIYADDMHYTLGIDYMMLQQFREAAEELLQVLGTSTDTALVRKAEGLFGFITRERLDSRELSSLFIAAKGADMKDLIALKMIEQYISVGDNAHAQSLLSERLNADSSSKYRAALVRLRTSSHSSSHYRIGVMLPLMSSSGRNPLQRLAGEMLDGFDFALKEYTGTIDAVSTITIDVRDVEMDSALVVRAMNEWAQSPDVLCVIGPLFSTLVTDAAPIANRYHLPLLTPTATTTGLTASGSYVFQLSPDYQTRGKAIARYAVRDMGFKNFAVLATTEPMGKSSESFSGEVSGLGGNILSVQSFQAGVTTIKEQCLAIRRAVLGTESDAENFDLPVNIDGIYLAIDDAEEIGVIIPQLLYFNIKGALLGNNEWYDKPHLDSQRKLVEGITFASDTYLEDKNIHLETYRTEFIKQTQKQPTKYTLIGYDAMNLVLSRLSRGNTTREELQTLLTSVKDYQGLHSMITLSPERVNSNLFLLQYRHGEIIKIADLGVQ